jgi:phage terminase small subunit
MKAERRCSAKSARTGQPCQKAPIKGGTVCTVHGGRAPQVQRKAAERLADLIDPDRALREAAGLAYSNIQDLVDEHGNLKPIQQLPRHVAATIASIEVVKKNLAAGDGQTDTVHKLKMWDKPKNLEMLFKHLGLLIEKLQHSGTLKIVHELSEADPQNP